MSFLSPERRERLWDFVDKRGADECWPWTAYQMDSGHGRFWNGERLILAHRAMYWLERGIIPDDLCVLHRCHNGNCVNPAHLYLGTRADNARDMVRDQSHGNRKLTDSEVLDMKRRYKENDDLTLADLGEEHDVHPGYVGLIMEGRRRTDVIADD